MCIRDRSIDPLILLTATFGTSLGANLETTFGFNTPLCKLLLNSLVFASPLFQAFAAGIVFLWEEEALSLLVEHGSCLPEGALFHSGAAFDTLGVRKPWFLHTGAKFLFPYFLHLKLPCYSSFVFLSSTGKVKVSEDLGNFASSYKESQSKIRFC
eukprot:TRINITY_DN6527_c0_g1_i13.p2 TRINITY_DN6527_c0_g1~~TRINITY_DN6527_c0_g1_i13.p2  ORF type:complete len:170 (-),score=11.33 TRINITY_DN6527_c0_g1_i13:993-1457(-)